MNTELILIRITGIDRPGLTASVTEILSKYDVTILDIGQADIHQTLSLGILFKSHETESGNIMKELLFKASELGVNIRFYPIYVDDNTWQKADSETDISRNKDHCGTGYEHRLHKASHRTCATR